MADSLPTLQEELAQILTGRVAWPVHGSPNDLAARRELLIALEKWHTRHTPTAPARETLTTLLAQFGIRHGPSLGNYNTIIVGPATGLYSQLVDALLALWMPTTQPTWCEHILSNIDFVPTSPHWFLRDAKGTAGTPVMDDWTCCPICGAPRPETSP